MKVILVNPPISFSYNPELSISYPLGLMYIAATLENKGIEVKIIDFVNNNNTNYIKNVIAKNSADIFGISVLSDNRHVAFSIVNIIRQTHKGVRIVLGGAHPTFLYKQILENIDVDAIFLGESESSFLRYVLKGSQGPEFLKKIPGIAFKDDNKNIIATQPEWEKDIDSIPKPAFHLIELDRYKNKFNEIDLHVLTSRGCPFRCNFCSVWALHKGHYRVHSVSRVIDELTDVQRFKKNIRVMLHDDFFSVDSERTKDLCVNILKHNIKLKWTVRSRVDRIDYDMLRLMKKSGCEGIFFGVETGSPKILKAMNKNFSLEDVKKAFSLTKKSGIKAICNIMIGYPGEDKKTLCATKDLLSVIRPDKVYFSPVKIFPGTALYDQCVQKGLIDDSFWIESKNKVPLYRANIGCVSIFWNMYKMKMSLEDNFFKKLIITYRAFFKEAILVYMRLFHRKGK